WRGAAARCPLPLSSRRRVQRRLELLYMNPVGGRRGARRRGRGSEERIGGRGRCHGGGGGGNLGRRAGSLGRGGAGTSAGDEQGGTGAGEEELAHGSRVSRWVEGRHTTGWRLTSVSQGREWTCAAGEPQAPV